MKRKQRQPGMALLVLSLAALVFGVLALVAGDTPDEYLEAIRKAGL